MKDKSFTLSEAGRTRATASAAGAAVAEDGCLLLGYRPPLRFAELLAFFRGRALAGVELVDDTSYSRTVRIPLPDGDEAAGWLRVEDDPARGALVLSMSESLLPATSIVVARVRRMFDLDCDPEIVFEGLSALDALRPGAKVLGTRLPGCFEPFETCCRAVLGQQVSVTTANRMAARVIERYGSFVDTGIKGLSRAFPTPAEILALGDASEALGPLGVIRTRSNVIAQLARMACEGKLQFDALADVPAQMEALLAVKGIGPWTANYIAMRAYSYPDAFLEGDVGVAHAMPGTSPKERLAAAKPCRPWRSYAVVSLWNSLED